MAKFVQIDRDGVFYAGQVVTGRIVFGQNLPDDLKQVVVKLQGNGETGWTEHESVYDSQSKKYVTRPVNYTQKEEYVFLRQTLWTDAPGYPLQRGQVIPFQFALPPDLPPTFEGAHGSVTYSVTALLKRPSLRFDKEETVYITVIPLCSMAHLRNMMEPVIMKKEKQLGLLVWKQGYIGATVTIPKQVYILGDSISVSGQITNHSSVSIKKTKASLHQTVTYFCSGKKKIEKSVVSKVKQGTISPGTIFQWTDISLPIPKSIPPSDFGPRCRLFQAEHSFQFTIDPSGMHFDVELEAALKLGTVWGHPPVGVPAAQFPMGTPLPGPVPMGIPLPGPLHGGMPSHPPGGMPAGSSLMPSAPPVGSLYPQVAFDAPPSYDEACGPPVEVGHEAGEDDIARSFEKVELH